MTVISTILLIILSVISYTIQIMEIVKKKGVTDLSLLTWELYMLYLMLYGALMIVDGDKLSVIIVTVVGFAFCLLTVILAIVIKNKQKKN